jgi:phenylacetate-CoA ligase
VTLMQDFGAHVLCATPSYALNIAEVAEAWASTAQAAAAARPVRRRAVERGHAGELEARLGIKAVDIYGLSEIMGPGVAANATWRRTACTAGRIISCSR